MDRSSGPSDRRSRSDDPRQFFSVGRIGRITGPLHAEGKTACPGARSHRRRVALVAADGQRPVLEGRRVAVVGTKALDRLLRHTRFVFRGLDLDRATFPAGPGLDAKQVVAGRTVAAADLAAAPAGFQRGLTQNETRRDTGQLLGAKGVSPVLLHEIALLRGGP